MSKNRYHQGPASDHLDGERFFSPDAPGDKSAADLLMFLAGTRFQPWPRHVGNPPRQPVVERIEGAALRVTTIGHASHLLLQDASPGQAFDVPLTEHAAAGGL